MSSWLSLKRKKERDELKEEKQRYYSSLVSSLSHFSRLSRAARIGVLSSLLIVEPLLLPVSAEAQEVQKAKDFKKQSSNIVKVESMAKGGDMGPVTKEKKIGNEEKIKKIEELMVNFSEKPSYGLYQKLKELRGTGPKATDEYKRAWGQFSNSNKKDVNKFNTLFKFYITLSDSIESFMNTKDKSKDSLVDVSNLEDKIKPSVIDDLNNRYTSLEFTLSEDKKTIIIKYIYDRVVKEDIKELFYWYELCKSNPDKLNIDSFNKVYDKIVGDKKADETYNKNFSAYFKKFYPNIKFEELRENVSSIPTILYDLNRFVEAGRKRDANEIDKISKRLSSSFAKEVINSIYGYDLVERYKQIINDKNFMAKIKDYEQEAKANGFSVVFLNLDLESQYSFFMDAKPTLEKAGLWNKNTLDILARYSSYGIAQNVTEYIDPVALPIFYSEMLKVIVEMYPDKLELLMQTLSRMDKEARQIGATKVEGDIRVREYYTKKSKELEAIKAASVQNLISLMQNNEPNEVKFTITPASERIVQNIVNVPRVSLPDLAFPFAYNPWVIEWTNWYIAEKNAGRIPEGVPFLSWPPKPMIEALSVLDGLRVLSDLSTIRRREVVIPQFTQFSTVGGYMSFVRQGVDKNAAWNAAADLAGPKSKLYAAANAGYDGKTTISMNALNLWSLENMKLDFKNEEFTNLYLNTFLDPIVSKDCNLVQIYERDEITKRTIIRTYIKQGNKWIRFFKENEVPEDKAIEMYYAGYTTTNAEMRLRMDKDKLHAGILGYHISQTDLATIIRGGDQAYAAQINSKYARYRFEIYNVDDTKELAATYLKSENASYLVDVGENKKIAMAMKYIDNNEYLDSAYYKTAEDWSGYVLGKKLIDSKTANILAAYFVFSRIANDFRVPEEKIMQEKGGAVGIEFKNQKYELSYKDDPVLASLKAKNPLGLDGTIEALADHYNDRNFGDATFSIGNGLSLSLGYQETGKTPDFSEYIEERRKKYHGAGINLNAKSYFAFLRGSIIKDSLDIDGYGWYSGGGWLTSNGLKFIILSSGEVPKDMSKDKERYWNIGLWTFLNSSSSLFIIVDDRNKEIKQGSYYDLLRIRGGVTIYTVKDDYLLSCNGYLQYNKENNIGNTLLFGGGCSYEPKKGLKLRGNIDFGFGRSGKISFNSVGFQIVGRF